MAATLQEEQIENYVDKVIRRYKTTQILYYPYESGGLDIYKQRTKTYGTPVELIGRAILTPTKEKLSMIGNDEIFDIAFLFSRIEMLKKFSSMEEGEWMNIDGEMAWWNRRYRIIRTHPTGQVGVNFLLMVILANSIPGVREG